MKKYQSPIIAEKIQEGKIYEYQQTENPQGEVVNDLPVVAAGAAVIAAVSSAAIAVHNWVG